MFQTINLVRMVRIAKCKYCQDAVCSCEVILLILLSLLMAMMVVVLMPFN